MSVRAAPAALLPLLLAACAGATPRGALTERGPAFSVDRFFAGRTEGEGRLHVAFRHSQPVHVLGAGRLEPDGTLVIDQEVQRGTQPPRHREWRIRTQSDGRVTGSLSDASGPVTGVAAGNRLVLRFPIRGGFAAEQRLFLLADGTTVRNRMVVRRLGLTVAVLDETIRHR